MLEFKNKKWSDSKWKHDLSSRYMFVHSGLILDLSKVSIKKLKPTISSDNDSRYNSMIDDTMKSLFQSEFDKVDKFKIINEFEVQFEGKLKHTIVSDSKHTTYKYLYDALQKNGMHIKLPTHRNSRLGTVHNSCTGEYIGVFVFSYIRDKESE